MADAIVIALQPFAHKGYSGYNATSACVGVLCAIAKETDSLKLSKFTSLTQSIELLKEQAVEWGQ